MRRQAAPHPGASLRSIETLSADDVARWQALADTAVEPNPYYSPTVTLAAHRHLGESGTALAVVEAPEGHWLACLPVTRRRRWRRVMGPCLMSWGHTHGFMDTPLVHPQGGVEALDPLVALLAGQRVAYLLLALVSGGGVANALRDALVRHGRTPLVYMDAERAALLRRVEPTYHDGVVSSKRGREMRRQRRLLHEALGAPLELIDRSDDVAAHRRFVELEASGWKGEEGTAFGSDVHQADFALDVMRDFAARGQLQLLALEAAGRTVAMKCNFRDADVAFCFKIAHDESLARLSPGVQLELEYVTRFHAEGRETWSDSCAIPANQMINRLWPDRRRIVTLVGPTRSMAGLRASLQAKAIIRARAALERVG